MSRNFFLLVFTYALVCISLDQKSNLVHCIDVSEAPANAASKAANVSTSVKPEVHPKREDVSKKQNHSGTDVDLTKLMSNNNVTVNENLPNTTTQVNILPTTANDFNRTAAAAAAPKWLLNIKSGALQRTGFVVLGIMSVLLFFFLVHAIRVRQKRSKSRKYGIIASNASDVEMEPLEKGSIEDDEEETTLFDAQHKFRIK